MAQPALERETERSLAAVGVTTSDFVLPERPAARSRSPKFAASGKRALHHALQVAGARNDRHVAAAHVLVGVLRAEIGTVPRVLAIARSIELRC